MLYEDGITDMPSSWGGYDMGELEDGSKSPEPRTLLCVSTSTGRLSFLRFLAAR